MMREQWQDSWTNTTAATRNPNYLGSMVKEAVEKDVAQILHKNQVKYIRGRDLLNVYKPK